MFIIIIDWGNTMQKNLLITISLITLVLLVLGSLTNVVGYQTVQLSNQQIIKEKINQKELLFQIIIDIENNKEIQKIALNSEINGGRLFNPNVRFSIVNTPVLTIDQLKHMYIGGLMLSKIFSESRIRSIIKQYQINDQGMQKKITTVIEKDAKLSEEMIQISNSKCDCKNDNTTRWNFPVLCMLLWPLYFFTLAIWGIYNIFYTFLLILKNIGVVLSCWWSTGPP